MLKLVAYEMFLMYIFKINVTFSDHSFPGLKTVLMKKPQKASAEEAVNSNFLSLMLIVKEPLGGFMERSLVSKMTFIFRFPLRN